MAIGTAALIALGDNDPSRDAEYRALGSAAGYYDDWQDGRDPAGITTQDDELAQRLDPVVGGRRLANFLRVMDDGGADHRPGLRQGPCAAPSSPRDLVALTIEAAAMARVPLAGTNWVPGQGL